MLLGLLTARHVAGDPRLLEAVRPAVLADWRASAVKRLPELRAGCEQRAVRYGEMRSRSSPN